MKITSIKPVKGRMVESHEINYPDCGLKCSALYRVEGLPFMYTVEFYNKHAPVNISADIVTLRIADDAPMIFIDSAGFPHRDTKGNILCTRTVTVMCPFYVNCEGEKLYYNGHSPEVVAQRFINKHLSSCKFGSPAGFVRRFEEVPWVEEIPGAESWIEDLKSSMGVSE